MNRLFKEMYEIHKKKLKNLDIKGEKLLITFAGVPGSGKTTIAEELEKEIKGVSINSIEVEKAYVSLGNKRDITVKRVYIDWLMDKIAREFKNKTIILDKGIERTYEDIVKWAKENDYKLFIIGVECNRKTAEKRLVGREGSNARYYLAEMDRWIREYNRYRKLGISDIEINTEEENLFVWTDKILTALNKKYKGQA